jgi:hypothetical protein
VLKLDHPPPACPFTFCTIYGTFGFLFGYQSSAGYIWLPFKKQNAMESPEAVIFSPGWRDLLTILEGKVPEVFFLRISRGTF